MPKPTFLNLRPEKRTAFTEAALYEFAMNSFQNASITNMVKVLGIAKGSVYQYFEHKKDLYEYLIELATAEKLQYTKKTIKKAGDGEFLKWLRKMMFQSLLFELEQPRLACLLNNVSQERHSSELGNLAERNRTETHRFFEKIIQLYQKKGALSKKVDVNQTALLLTHIMFGFSEGFFILNGIDIQTHAAENTSVIGLEETARKFAKAQISALAPMFQ